MKTYKWKKKPKSGGHSFRSGGRLIRTSPGDVVEATKAALGGFYTEYECLAEIVDGEAKPLTGNPVTEAEEEEKLMHEAPTSLIIVARGGGWYDVINPDLPQMPLNDRPLRKREAEALL